MFLTLFNKSQQSMVHQKELILPYFSKGYHLITHYIEKEIKPLPQTGLINIFIKHTSAALSLNENADSSVRTDMENYMDKLVPDDYSLYTHILEGNDDIL